MPVLVGCPCGQQMRVAAEHAGRSVRCPGCGTVLTVPAPRPAPAAGAVHFRCACGQAMQARAEFAGRAVKCPGCNAVLPVPGAAPAPASYAAQPARQAPPPPPPQVRRPPPIPAHGPPPPRTPRRFPWVLVTVALVLVLAGGGAAWFFWGRGKANIGDDAAPPAAEDLAYVPADSFCFVSVRFAELWGSDAWKRTQRQLPPGAVDTAFLENELGFPPTEIERASVVFADVAASLMWSVVLTAKPYDKAKLIERLAGPGASPETADGKPIYRRKGNPNLWFHCAGERVLVLGDSRPSLVKALAGAAKADQGPHAAARRTVAEGKLPLVVALSVPLDLAFQARQALPADLSGLAPALTPSSATLTGDLGADLRLRLTAAYPDADKAGKAKDAVVGGVALARVGLAALKQNLPREALRLFAQMEAALNTVEAEATGAEVVVRLHADPAELVAAAVAGGGAFPGLGLPRP